MPYIFHQNMRTFGGCSSQRNNQYNVVFQSIRATLVPNIPIWVGGFTEILNTNDGNQHAFANFAEELHSLNYRYIFISVGFTGNQQEYIVISWNPYFMGSPLVTAEWAGSVLYYSQKPNWRLTPPTSINDSVQNGYIFPLPADRGELGVDARGLAFIAATISGGGQSRNFIFGFMHNMYNVGDRSSNFTNIPTMVVDLIKGLQGQYNNAEVIIGGDFNVEPRNPINLSKANSLVCLAAKNDKNEYIKTTLSNPYDFWLLSNRNDIFSARVLERSRLGDRTSDHAATLLFRQDKWNETTSLPNIGTNAN